MPTVIEVIKRTEGIRPNKFDDETRCEWLNHLEGRIAAELFREKEFKPYKLPEDNEAELRLRSPYDDVYDWYIYAMTDIAHREYDAYQIDMEMFNAAWNDAEIYIRGQSRKNRFINVVP